MEVTPRRGGWWAAGVLVAGAVAAIGVLEPLPGLWVRFTLIVAALAAVVVGTVRNRPSRPRPWWILAAGLAASAAGDVTVLVVATAGDLTGNVPADAWLTALSGLLLLVGMVDVTRSSLAGPNTGALDAVIVTVASGIALWQLLVVQAATPGWTGSGTELAGAIQVTALLGVLALLVRVGADVPAPRRTSILLLTAGLVAALAAFLLGAVRDATGGIQVYGGVRGALGAAANLAAGAAALHPSMRILTEPRESAVRRPSRRNTTALGLAVASPLLVLLGATATGAEVAPVSLAIAGLVLVATVMIRIERVQRARERTQVELRRTEARLISLVANTGDTVLLVAMPPDGPSHIRFASPSARRLLGRRPEELRRVDPRDVVDGEDRDRFDELLRGDDLPRVGDVRAAHLDGSRRWVEAVIAAAPGEDERSVVVTLRDVDVRKRQELELLEAASRDVLTGLWNRRAFHLALDAALAAASVPTAGSGAVAVLVVDLDGFKQVNDLAGHGVGDAVLQRLARRLEGIVRDGDLVARYGGDEFAVLCHDVEATAALTAVAERIVAVGAEPVVVDGEQLRVGLSVGVAIAGAGESGADLVARADAAMYAVKHDGKGRYALADARDARVDD